MDKEKHKFFFHFCTMMKSILISLLGLVFSFFLSSQEGGYFLTPQEKAYIYHTIRKSPILEHNIGRYIAFIGKEITLPNGEINYDSTEQVIINKPELLKIHYNDIRRSPKGILAELSNKTAIWELNKLLQSKRDNSLIKDGNLSDFNEFESLLLQYLPSKAKRTKKGEQKVRRRIEKLSNPTLTFNDKIAMLDGFASWTEEQKMAVISAYNKTINEWVGKRTLQIFQKLGGEADYFKNVLTAAGDGSNTSGLFEEREKDQRGRWNKGLPKAVGLFPYEPYIGLKPNTKKKNPKPQVLPKGYTIHQFETKGNGKETNIHVDVWGYNSEKQTTVVIQKLGKYYPLFGSSDNRFLSPDSSFGGKGTYYGLIQHLKRDIQKLHDKIDGKKGIDYWVKYYEKERDKTKLDIDKNSKNLSTVRQSTITTNKKYKTDSNQKERGKKQKSIVDYYGELNAIEKKLDDLAKERKEILLKIQALNLKLQKMYDLIGREWVCFEENDGMYIYDDSSRFDLLTQEFTFPASEAKTPFVVKLLAIPMSYESHQYDEVMLHINITDANPMYTSQFHLNLNDSFDSDEYQLKTKQLFSQKDSIAVMEFFEALLNRKKDFNIIVRGGGIGKWKDDHVVIDYFPHELDQYPGKNDAERKAIKEDSLFKRLRSTALIIHVDRSILLQVNSFTDPVRSHFKPEEQKMLKLMQKYNLSSNQMLSAYRSYATLKQMKSELNVLAGKYLSRKDASKVIDRLNKSIDKSKITMGKTSAKYKWF